MTDPFLGMIALFGFNFAPRGWAFCNGQLLSISQNSALFALLGTQYGGDGVNTFALPNLQSRVPLGMGQGPGLSNYTIGQQGGSENVTLLSTQMPAHNHMLTGSGNAATVSDLRGSVLASTNGADTVNGDAVTVHAYAPAGNAVVADPSAITPAGGNQPHENVQPYLAMNYCIALQGIFPSRN
ncbi:phage tail protein [Spirosoma arcticum]